MDPILLFGSVGIPAILGIGGVVAWRATRTQQTREVQPKTWRDDSLDEWRNERDARADAERQGRATEAADGPHGEARAESERVEQRHTRLGG